MFVISFKISNFSQNVHPDRKLGCFNIPRRCPVSWLLMAESGHWWLMLRNVIRVMSTAKLSECLTFIIISLTDIWALLAYACSVLERQVDTTACLIIDHVCPPWVPPGQFPCDECDATSDQRLPRRLCVTAVMLMAGNYAFSIKYPT